MPAENRNKIGESGLSSRRSVFDGARSRYSLPASLEMANRLADRAHIPRPVMVPSAANHNCQATTTRVPPASRLVTHFSFQVAGRFTVVAATGRPV